MESLVSCCSFIIVATVCFVVLSIYVFTSKTITSYKICWFLQNSVRDGEKLMKNAKRVLKNANDILSNGKDPMWNEPKGFPNIGSTCFMNATLQCLIWSPCLQTQLAIQILNNDKRLEMTDDTGITAALMELAYEVHCSPENSSQKSFWSFCGRDSKNVSKKTLQRLLVAARKINDQFEGYSQQDSFEIYNTIISGIEEELETAPKPSQNSQQKQQLIGNPDSTVNNIARLFEGKFVNIYYHTECRHVELVFQSFTSLCIPFPYQKARCITENEREGTQRGKPGHTEGGTWNKEPNNITEEDSTCGAIQKRLTLKHHHDKWSSGLERGLEMLSEIQSFGEDELPCRKCQKNGEHVQKGSCLKLLYLASLPPVLVFQINRFKQEGTGLVKIQERVTYAGEIDVGPFCLNTGEIVQQDWIPKTCQITNTIYSLYGVVNHKGTLKGGHYYAYIKTTERQADHIYQQLQKHDTCDIEKVLERFPEVIEDLIKTEPYKAQQQTQTTERELNKSASWYYVSDKRFHQISSSDVEDNDHAYILMYELKAPSSS